MIRAMIRPALVCLALCPAPALAESPALGHLTGQPFEPGAIIGRMGKVRTGIVLTYDNTRMTADQATVYAHDDCADFDRKLDKLSFDPPDSTSPTISTARYTCR